MPRSLRTPKINHAVFAKTLHLLQQGAVSAYTIAAHTNVKVDTAYKWLRALHKQRTVHVSSWLKDTLGRERIPVFSLGKDRDVPRKKIPRQEIVRAYQERQKEKRNAEKSNAN